MITKIINSIKKVLSIDNDKLHKAVSEFDLYNANTRRLHRHYENMINTIEDDEIKKSFEEAHFEDINELYKSNIDVTKTLSECIDKRIDDLQKGKTEYAYKDKMKKSLGMSRDKMPQVDSDNITDFILHFDQKVGVSKVKRKLSQLKPAQGEINEDKLNYFLANKKNEKVKKTKYIISNDNYLIDGHHRWAANLELKNENDTVSCYRINLPAQELVKRANKLNVTKNVDINDNALTKSLVTIALAKTQGLISDELTDIIKARVNTLVPVERIKIKDGKQFSSISYIDKDVFEKSRTGVYEDNAENRRLKRVGQKYGSAGKNEPEANKNNKKQEDTTQDKTKKTVEEYAKETSDADLQNAAKGEDEKLRIAAKKELERRETEHNPEEDKTGEGKDKESEENKNENLSLLEKFKLKNKDKNKELPKRINIKEFLDNIIKEGIETKEIERIAKENKLWKQDLPEIKDNNIVGEGSESIVYNYGNNNVLKVKDFSQYKSIKELIESIQVHNEIFPETKQEILGVLKNKNGDLSLAIKQSKISKNLVHPSKDEIRKDMEQRGFAFDKGNSYKNGDIVVSDLFPSDVFKDKEGTLYYIDSIIKNTSTKKTENKKEEVGLKEGDLSNVGIIQEVYKDQYRINNIWYHKRMITPVDDSDKEVKEQAEVNDIISKLEEESGKGFITLYHGTDSKTHESINKKGVFGQDSTISFLTSNKKEAKEYSNNKAKYRGVEKGNVLEVTIPKWSVKKNLATGEYETELTFENRSGKWYPTNKSILSVYGKKSNDITKSSEIDLANFESNDISKSIDIIIKALESGIIEYDNIEKAHKYIRKEPDGKGGFNYIYEETKDHQKKDVKFDIGTTISDNEKGLDIERYSEKAIIIKGNTYANVDLLRKIKEEIGVGNWNKALKGWVFPLSYVDQVMGYIISNTDDEDKKEALINTKNASVEVGESVTIAGNLTGKVEANTSDETGIKYDVALENGTKLTGVDEKVMEVKPETDDAKISDLVNNSQPENRAKIEKKIFGIKPIENIYQYSLYEYLDMHGITGESDLAEELREKHIESILKAIEEGKEIPDKSFDFYPNLKEAYAKKRQAMSEETKRKISEALKKHKVEPETVEKTNVEEVKKKLEDFVNSLSEEDINKMRVAYSEAKNKLAEEYQTKLAETIVEKESLMKQYYDLNQQARETADFTAKGKLQEDAREFSKKAHALEPRILNIQNKIQSVSKGGELSTMTDKTGLVHTEIPNLKNIPTLNIDYNIDTILTDEKPDYIPYINEDKFKSKGFILDAIRVDNDTYMVATNSHSEKGESLGFSFKTQKNEYTGYNPEDAGYVLLSLDQLVLTNDYYVTKQKAKYIEAANKQNKRQVDYWNSFDDNKKLSYYNQKGFYNGVPAAVKKKVTKEQWDELPLAEKEKLYIPVKKYNPERLKTKLEDNEMWSSFHDMYNRFIDLEAKPYDKSGKKYNLGEIAVGRFGHEDVFATWHDFSEMLNWKMNDIKIQRETDSEIRKQALETSFGESNTNDSLKKELGILVKRQNGDQINPLEIEQVKKAWEDVQKTFGSLKENAASDNLKISHSGNKYIYASNASGMYVPTMKTIAVSAKHGENQFGFTLGHEVAHWIDNHLGKGDGKRYASDNYESTAGKLAIAFRKGLNEKTSSKYANSTTECFARALEQYNAIMSKGEMAEMAKQGRYFASRDYVSKEHFEQKVKPLIEQFFKENKEFLKAFGDDMFPSQLKLQLD
jgi:preprotein translocase subunit YajC